MNQNIYNMIKNGYEKKQKAAFDGVLSRRGEVYSKIPRLQEIDSHIRLSGIKYNKMILLGTNPVDKAITELISKVNELRMERELLLTEHGYPANYLEISYCCPLCKDTGYLESGVGSEKCVCYKQQLINHLYSQSNLKLAETENFSSFDESFFPDVIDETRYKIKVSPREHILRIKERCIKFIENFSSPDEKSLFFSGPTGVGKTFLANCIASELLNRGKTVLYQTAPVLFDTINEYKMKAYKEEGFDMMRYKNIFDVELLIIDDLGTEPPSAAKFTELLNILNTRQAVNLTKSCKTIVSTNIGMKELHEYYDERIASRIIGCFDMFWFAGQDIRSVKRFSGVK